MKFSKMISVVGFVLLGASLIGCSTSASQSSATPTEGSSSNDTIGEKTSSPHAVAVVSSSGLEDWDITPYLSEKSAYLMLDVDVHYNGADPADNVKIQFGNATVQSKELKHGEMLGIGTSYGAQTNFTLTISWQTGNQAFQGTEQLSLK